MERMSAGLRDIPVCFAQGIIQLANITALRL